MNGKNYSLYFLLLYLVLFTARSFSESGKNPYFEPNNTWISISGTVESVFSDRFVLDYGESVITVEMADTDRHAETYALEKGDSVIVNGRIDDDFFDNASIEASSVYIDKIHSYFYASAIDEERFTDYSVWYNIPIKFGAIVIQGYVTSVNEEKFILNTGNRSVTINVGDMANNPLDKKGYLRIDIGDVVRVGGSLEGTLLSDRELEADSVVMIYPSQLGPKLQGNLR